MTESRNQSTIRRPVLVTAILLVAVAVLLVALRSWLDRPAEEIGIGSDSIVAAEAATVAPVFEPEPNVEQPVKSVQPGVPVQTLPPTSVPAEPLRVVMLPVRMDDSETAAAFVLDAIQQATVRALRDKPNIEVVEIGSAEAATVVPPNSGPLGEDGRVSRAIIQRYDADVVAQISERSPPEAASWSINLSANRSQGWTAMNLSFSKTGAQPAGYDVDSAGRVESAGRRFAEMIARNPGGARPSRTSSGDERSILSDATQSEQERLRALGRILNEGFDSGTLAAAVDLANRSSSAETLQQVWHLLRQSAYDVTLAQPFSYALLTDPYEAVRREAALGLGAYLGIVGSQAALEQATRSDSSPDVRLAARMAMMDYDQQQDFRHETLLDRKLTPVERFAPTMLLGSSPVVPFPITYTVGEAEHEALAYAEIVSGTDDTDLKLRALVALQGTLLIRGSVDGGESGTDPEIVRVLVESERSTNADVRRAALQAMSRRSDVPEIRTVLESVVECEPELAEQLGIARTLERLGRSQP